MKKLILIVVILSTLLISTTSFAQCPRERLWFIRYDHALHFGISSYMALMIDQYEKHPNLIWRDGGWMGWQGEDFGLLSIGVPIVVGVIKEILDGKGTIDKEGAKDLFWGSCGAISGKLFSLSFSL